MGLRSADLSFRRFYGTRAIGPSTPQGRPAVLARCPPLTSLLIQLTKTLFRAGWYGVSGDPLRRLPVGLGERWSIARSLEAGRKINQPSEAIRLFIRVGETWTGCRRYRRRACSRAGLHHGKASRKSPHYDGQNAQTHLRDSLKAKIHTRETGSERR